MSARKRAKVESLPTAEPAPLAGNGAPQTLPAPPTGAVPAVVTPAALAPVSAPKAVARSQALAEMEAEDLQPGTMTKRKLVVSIAKELEEEANDTGRLPLTQMEVFGVVQRVLDHIYHAVARGEKVELRNFGVFEAKCRRARVGRNPNDPSRDVPIPARAVVRFKPGKELRRDVLAITPQILEREAKRLQTKTSKRGRRRRKPLAPAAAPPAPAQAVSIQ